MSASTRCVKTDTLEKSTKIVVKAYDVAVGKVSTLTPEGEFQIINQIQNPTYYGSGVVIAPGNGNPLGTRWMGLSAKGYGIHGTNAAGPLSSRVEAFEGATIRAELERARHNMTETARALGSERSHLYKKCAQLGIQVKQLRSTEG